MENTAIIGEYFKALRLMYGLSRTELAGALAMSEKTLQRIELGQVEAKARQCLAFLDYFGVTPAELIRLIDTGMPSPDQVEHQLLAAQDDQSKLAQLEEQLTGLARKTHSEWIKNSLLVCQILRLEKAGKGAEAQARSDRFVDHVHKGDFMTNFDFWLLTRVADQVSYDKLSVLLASGQLKTHLNDCNERRVATIFYCRLLDSALKAKNAEAILTACGKIQRQSSALDTYRMYAYQRFSELLMAALRGQEAGLAAQVNALIGAVATICPPAEAARLTTEFKQGMSVVEQLTGSKAELAAMVKLPAQRKEPVESQLNPEKACGELTPFGQQ